MEDENQGLFRICTREDVITAQSASRGVMRGICLAVVGICLAVGTSVARSSESREDGIVVLAV